MIARVITIGFGLALLVYNHLRAVDAHMGSLVHAVPPHARLGDSPARLVTVVLIAVATYTAFLIPRQIWERRAVRKFFGTATRFSLPAEQLKREQSAHHETPVTEAATVG